MCVSDIGFFNDKKLNLLTSDKLDMCTILLEKFNHVFTTPLPNKQVTDPESLISVESITSQDVEVFLTNIIIIESIINDFNFPDINWLNPDYNDPDASPLILFSD